MVPTGDGYFTVRLPRVEPGTLYQYLVDGRGPFPDPASRYQPHGVHGPSAVVDPAAYSWNDHAWTGIPLEHLVLYELHVGAFTPQGTFLAAAERLPELVSLGITAVELMPVADFPGSRGWGYDGVALFAPARCYGTPDDLRYFVDRAHALGLGVYLDVVYNHLGPDGAYQGSFSPYYYSKAHHSPWGDGINFDGPRSAPVRDYCIENALRWVHEYHIDGLRLDATHAIEDDSPRHVLASVSSAIHASLAGTERLVHVIAEDERNLAGLLAPESDGGWQLAGVWSDDFHHQMRRAVAGDSDGYFAGFDGSSQAIAETAKMGWYYSGQFAPHSGRARGTDPTGIDYSRFVFCIQNHDQIGNRAFGDRLHHQIDLATYRAASALLLLLPETPLLFMGQEWAATSPFLYFTDHNPELGRLVTQGRRREFSHFAAFADEANRARIPDPQAEATFQASHLNWEERAAAPHKSILEFYRHLLQFRKTDPALRKPGASAGLTIEAVGGDSLLLRRQAQAGSHAILAVIRLRGFGAVEFGASGLFQLPPHLCWQLAWTSEDSPFAPDAQPVVVDELVRSITFARPGAAVFQMRQEGGVS